MIEHSLAWRYTTGDSLKNLQILLIASPLHTLDKGGQQEFSQTSSADRAFDVLKSPLCSATILSLPNFSSPFTVYTDASDLGLDAVLAWRRGEHEHVIAYAEHCQQQKKKLFYDGGVLSHCIGGKLLAGKAFYIVKEN